MIIEISNLTKSECDESRLESVASFAMESLGIHRDSELSISLVDEDEMCALHVRWMDEPGATDVLSFPMDEMKPHSADDHRESEEKKVMFGLQEEFLGKWRSKA